MIAKIDQWLSFRQGPVLIGVSGGPDSLVLFHLLVRGSRKVAMAHLDHGLRPDSGGDYQFVEKLAGEHQIAFYGRHEKARLQAEMRGQSLEEASRELRYQFLFEIAEQIQAAAVAVGHTADDQVETVLMHLLRGAGTTGLQGMQPFSLPNRWSTEIPLIRPLLNVWRTEVETYCQNHNLEPLVDQSNLDTRFTRNRLRVELIPELETYNPKVKAAILRSSQVLQAESELLQPIFDRAWTNCVLWESDFDVRIRLAAILSEPLAVRRQIIKRAIQQLAGPDGKVIYDWVNRTLEFLQTARGAAEIEIGGGIVVSRTQDQIWIYKKSARTQLGGYPLLEAGQHMKVPVPGSQALGNGWHLQASWTAFDQTLIGDIVSNADPYQCWLQMPEKVDQLVLRSRAPGERVRPLGMRGHSMKLSDYMTNVHIPAPVRDRWPLVVIHQQIAWVPGHTIGQDFRVTEKKSPILHLKLTAENADRGDF